MSVLIALPVYRLSCTVGIDRGRAWSVVDEVILWSIARQAKSVDDLVVQAAIPRQLILASIARLMRFRLVELAIGESGVTFKTSEYGFKAVSSGDPLPFFPKRIPRRVSFVIERATGEFFATAQIRLMNRYKLDQARDAGNEVRQIVIEGGAPSLSHEDNLGRLSKLAVKSWDEQIAVVEGRTATMRDDEFIVLRVIGGIAQGLPESAGTSLRHMIETAAALPSGTTTVAVSYDGPTDRIDAEPTNHACSFDERDLIIGGSAQLECLRTLLAQAHRRVIVHSTFLHAERFVAIREMIREACGRGVRIDLLWGADKDEETQSRNATAAADIAKLVREDSVLRGRFRVHMKTTGSHAKLILLDTVNDTWTAAVGSCNWFSSPFQAVELSVVLRDQHVVADVAVALQRLVGRRGLSDEIATEMAMTARDLRQAIPQGGDARLALIAGDAHEGRIRAASGSAARRFMLGSNRLGSTARPGALMQSEVAAGRHGVRASVLYSQASGPLKNRHARELAEEAQANGFSLIRTRKIPLHGKFLAWDEDDLIVTSLNWASASADIDFPWGDIGVHIHASGIAAVAMARLQDIFPELAEEQGSDGVQRA